MATTALPELTGSEKQIAWAHDIRARLVEWLTPDARETADGRPTARGQMSGDYTEYAREMAPALDYLLTITDAKWWIDHRMAPIDLLMETETMLATRSERGLPPDPAKIGRY